MKPQPAIAAGGQPSGALAAAAGNHARHRQISSIDLFGGGREIIIEHAGEFYSLRQTSKGKLILTK